MNTQYKIFTSLFCFFLIFSSQLSIAASDKLNVDKEGLFIHGYDPVAYHTSGHAIIGDSKYQLNYEGAKILFSSEENKEMFSSNPEQYLPSYGGHCSYGIRSGRLSDSDPKSWEIVDGRLYLMFNKGTELIWKKNAVENIEVADKLWPDKVR